MAPSGSFTQPRSSSSPLSVVGSSTSASSIPLDVRGTFAAPVQADTHNDNGNENEKEAGLGGLQGGPHSLGPSPLRRGQACQACRRRKLKCDAARPVCGTCTRSRKAAASANHASPVADGDCVYDDVPATFLPSAVSNNVPHSGHASDLQSRMRRASNAVAALGVKLEGSDSTGVETSPQKRRKTVDGGMEPPGTKVWARSEGIAMASAGEGAEGGSGLEAFPSETAEDRSQRLESRIHQLEYLLKQAHNTQKRSSRRRDEDSDASQDMRSEASSTPAVPIFSMLSPSSGREERYRMQYSQRPARYGEETSSNAPGQSKDPKQPVFNFGIGSIEINRDEQVRHELANGHLTRDDPILQLLWPGWSTDLPSPDTVMTMCETFFRLHPMRSLVYKPSFMSGLSLPPKHPHRPHDSLIHAILATTADISPFHDAMKSSMQDRFVMLLSDARSRPNNNLRCEADQLSFKEFHLRKAREKVEHSLITDFRNPLDWIAASLLACFTLWNDYRITESYFLSAILCRATSPAGLDKLPARRFKADADSVRGPGLFGTVQGTEEHERRLTLWHIFITDQYTSGPPSFYENLLSESSILTNLPCRVADFQAGKDAPPNTQTLTSPDLFRTGHLDEFTLHIKSAVLVRRACSLHCRNQLTKKKPPGLSVVDKHISEFLESFPSFDFESKEQMNVDKLAAWSNISLAIFHLHEPYLTPTSITVKESNPASSYSIGRVNMAVEKVLETIHHLMNSSFDFALLHPQMFLAWSVCGRMLGKDLDVLKRKGTTGESNALRMVMERLQWIIWALERAGEKNIKARRCSELVSYVKSGTLHESILRCVVARAGWVRCLTDD